MGEPVEGAINAQQEERLIEGVNYRAWPVAFGVGLKALLRLMRILSPVLARVYRETGSPMRAAALLESLPESLTDADVDYFSELYGAASQYQDEAGNWFPLIKKKRDEHFAGARYLEFFRWLIFCTEVNFSGFFAGMKGADLDSALAKMPGSKPAEEPQPIEPSPGSPPGNGSGGGS